MQKYYVWKDNLLEDYFALEVEEFDNNTKFKATIINEKNELHIVEGDGSIDAIKKYKESLEKIKNNESEDEVIEDLTPIKKKKLLH